MENFLNKLVDPKLPQDQQKKLRSRYASLIVCAIVVVSAAIVLIISSAISGSALDNRVAEVIATVDENNQSALDELKAAEEALQSVTDELDAAKEVITALTERLDAADEAAKSSDERIAAAEAAISDATTKLEEETEKLAEGTSTQIGEAIATLTADLEKAGMRIDEVESVVNGNKEAIAAINENNAAHDEQFAVAQSDIAYLLETMRLVAKSALTSTNRLDKAESAVAKLTESVEMDKDALTTAQADIEELKKAREEAKATQGEINTTVQESIDAINVALDDITGELQAVDAAHKEFELQQNQINEFIAEQLSKFPAAEKNISYLLDTMKIVAKGVLENGNRLDKAVPAIAAVEADIEALDTGLSAAGEAIAEGENALTAYAGEVEQKLQDVAQAIENASLETAEKFTAVDARIAELEKTHIETNAVLQKAVEKTDATLTTLVAKTDADTARIDEIENTQKSITSRVSVVTDNVNGIESRMAESDVTIEDLKTKLTSLTNRQAKTDAVVDEFTVATTDRFSLLEQKADDTIINLESEKDKLSVYIEEEAEKDKGISARLQVAEVTLKGVEKHEDRLKSLEASIRKVNGQIKTLNPNIPASNRTITPPSGTNSPVETLAALKDFVAYSSEVSVIEMPVIENSSDYEWYETPDQTDIFKNVYQTSFVPYSFDEPAENFESNDWAEYDVNDTCVSLSGIVYVPEVMEETGLSRKLFIYGDDVLLFESEPMDNDAEPQAFCVDLEGISVVTVVYENSANFLVADFMFQVR